MLVDLLELVIPAATALAGFAAGMLVRRRRAPKPVRAICPCEHSVAFHVGGIGGCQQSIRQATEWDPDYGTATSFTHVPCACQVYAGPEVISSITMRETTFGEIAGPDEQA